ncbi:MAG TPA: pyridoxal phosphate-dependent aminotransferase [Rhabdochlamydiaceae bacterium]|jgi:aspartate/methionine/tyrosine aminotransferase|nr:pyridoxal phosphate-dependent aminotransferase [Rhabdochlamydiaceae bacterium]
MPKHTKVSRLANVPGIGVDRMGNAADAVHDPELLRLENLDTDIPPPKIALEITRQGIGKDENNSYLPFLGQDELRKAAAKRVSRVSGIPYDWRTQCIISAGAMSGILNCLLAMLEPGDEVIITDPVYAGIINRIRLAGGVTVFVPLIPSPAGWRLDITALEQAVSPRTKMLLISPGMPTGHVLTQAEWEAVARVCIKTDAWLLYDAAVERILYDGRSVIHPASLPHMQERTITVGSAAKELRMIGWRIGWIVGPESLMNDIGLVSISNTVCQIGISMAGVAAGLNAADDGLKAAIKVWEERRNTLLQELDGLPVIPPHGGWSLLLDAEALGMTSQEASERLFKEAKIAATPMSGWGENAAKYLRFVFSNEPKERLLGMGKKVKRALGIF